jgi:hypothetical protein
MDDQLYHIDEVKRALKKLNPHLELKEYRKHHSNFTVDFVLVLSEQQEKVEVPMDLFRDFEQGGREEVEERLKHGYAGLLRKLEEK